MILQRLTLLIFFLAKTGQASETCNVLFVVDGSSYWPSFKSELTSISTTANLLYSSSALLFNANYWLYGNGTQDQPIPNDFFPSKDDFLAGLSGVKSSQGQETIVEATVKLNEWSTHDALIVLYTASPQKLINLAGPSYTERARTIVIHLNDGVDVHPISDFPSPQISEYGEIVFLVTDACKHIPTRAPPITTTSAHISSVSTSERSPSFCTVFFYLDASFSGFSSYEAQINVTLQAAHYFYDTNFTNGVQFGLAVAAYGQEFGRPSPEATSEDYASFVQSIEEIGANVEESLDNTIEEAIDEMNSYKEFADTFTVLFTNTNQSKIDASQEENSQYGQTFGVGVTGQVLNKFAMWREDMRDERIGYNIANTVLYTYCL